MQIVENCYKSAISTVDKKRVENRGIGIGSYSQKKRKWLNIICNTSVLLTRRISEAEVKAFFSSKGILLEDRMPLKVE